MPSQSSQSKSSSSGDYSYKSSGTNSQVRTYTMMMAYSRQLYNNVTSAIEPWVANSNQGNHYCSRDYGSSASNSNSYHYSNTCVTNTYGLSGRY